jgi:hypothetical protein
VLAEYIIPDMVAKVRGNGTVDDAIKWATDQMKPIFEKNKTLLTPVPPTPSQ